MFLLSASPRRVNKGPLVHRSNPERHNHATSPHGASSVCYLWAGTVNKLDLKVGLFVLFGLALAGFVVFMIGGERRFFEPSSE